MEFKCVFPDNAEPRTTRAGFNTTEDAIDKKIAMHQHTLMVIIDEISFASSHDIVTAEKNLRILTGCHEK